MSKGNISQTDELRIRFTAWITVVVQRAKIDYIRKQNRQPSLVIFLFTLQIILRGLITEKQMKIYPCWSLKKSMCLLIKVINLVRIHMP